LSVTVTLSQSQVEKLLGIIEDSERCLLEARSILSMNAISKPAARASPSDDFAFDFVSDRDGRVSKEKEPIVDYIKQKGPFQVEFYEITLSKDWKFLQRKRV